jgi:hypothetical protein
MFIKPYFWPKNTYDIKTDELETIDELDKLKTFTEPDELKAPPPILEVPKKLTKATKLAIKHGRGCL